MFALSRLACYLFICVCVLQLVKLPPALAIFGTKYEQHSNKCCNCICQNIRINQNISTSELGKKTSLKPFSMFALFRNINHFSYITRFWLCFCHSIKRLTRYELRRFTSERKAEENAFRLLCSETDQKTQF